MKNGKVGILLLIYVILFWCIIFISSIPIQPWFAVVFVLGILISYTIGVVYFVKKEKPSTRGDQKVFYRETPHSQFWASSPLLIWFLIEIFMGNELLWMYVGGVIYLVGFPLLVYLLDREFQLQKIILDQKQLIIIESSETKYDWEWLRGNCRIENDTLVIQRRWIERNKFHLGKYGNSGELMELIREKVSLT